jgi:hypothetical protein
MKVPGAKRKQVFVFFGIRVDTALEILRGKGAEVDKLKIVYSKIQEGPLISCASRSLRVTSY